VYRVFIKVSFKSLAAVAAVLFHAPFPSHSYAFSF